MRIVPDSEVPDGLVMPAACCTMDFDVVCKRIVACPAVRYLTYSRKLQKPRERYRCVGLRFDGGRLATLLKEDRDPYFQIWLQRKGYGYNLKEVEDVRQFIGVEKEEVVLLDNALQWIQPEDSEPLQFDTMTEGWRVRD